MVSVDPGERFQGMQIAARRRQWTVVCCTAVLTVLCGLFSPPATAQGAHASQWYLQAMQAEQMWDVSTGHGITVAVIDGKVDGTVPELRGQTLRGKDFANDRDRSRKDDAHATNMALLIAGRADGTGLHGLAPGSKILPLATGGLFGTSTVGYAIRYAADSGAQIINVSLGGDLEEFQRTELQEAVDYANRHGSLIFAGTGNHAEKGNVSAAPADLPGVVGVGAIDKSLSVAKFSVYGPQVALTAPGVDVPIRCSDGTGYCVSDGTSDSTAIASASAALIWSQHPDWTNNQVLRVMMETAVKPNDGVVPSKYLGYGIVRPRKVLLDNEGDPGPPDVNPLFPDYQVSEPSASPSPTQSSSTPEKDDRPGSEPVDRASDRSSDATSTWFAVAGVAAVVVIGGGTTYALLRRRSRR